MYQFKIAETNDIERLIAFFKDVYKPGHIMGDPQYLAWQYRDIPENQFFPKFSNILLMRDAAVVGHVGLIPYLFTVYGKKIKTAFAASFIVAKDLRSQGSGIFLLREAEKYFDLVYAIGLNKEGISVFNACRFAPELRLTRWVRGAPKEKKISSGSLVRIKNFGVAWENSWERLKTQFPITIERTSAYLNWRFLQHPKITYEILGFEESGRDGYMALRVENGNEFRALRIVDCVASSEGMEILLNGALAKAYEEKVDFIDFFCTSSVYAHSLGKSGFYLYDAGKNPEPPLFIIPTDRKRTHINFTYKFISQQFTPKLNDWFITKADGDKDRAW